MILTKLYAQFPRFSATVAVMAAIAYLTLVPRPLPEVDVPMFPGADKVVHAVMFGTLAAVMMVDVARWRGREVGFWCSASLALVAILLGGLVELLQMWMGMGRGAEWWDFAADAAGALVALCFWRVLERMGVRASEAR